MAIFGSKEIESLKNKIASLEVELERVKGIASHNGSAAKQYKQHYEKLHVENVNLKGKITQLEVQLEKADKTVEGLREAVGRWRKKNTGKENAGAIVGQSYDGKKHRIEVMIPLPPDMSFEKVWEITKSKINNQSIDLKRIRSTQDGWIATFEKSVSLR